MPWISPSEAAKYCRISDSRFRRDYIETGVVRAVPELGGRRCNANGSPCLLVNTDDLDALLRMRDYEPPHRELAADVLMREFGVTPAEFDERLRQLRGIRAPARGAAGSLGDGERSRRIDEIADAALERARARRARRAAS